MTEEKKTTERRENDDYPTMPWVTKLLFRKLELPSGRWLEPCAGAGAIIRDVPVLGIRWNAVELQDQYRNSLANIRSEAGGVVERVLIGDFFMAAEESMLGKASPDPAKRPFDVTFTNPPFLLAQDFIEACRLLSRYLVLLLRLNFLASGKRADMFAVDMPDIYVLPDRPSFTGTGSYPADYGWFVWGPEARSVGAIQVLPSLPREERPKGEKVEE